MAADPFEQHRAIIAAGRDLLTAIRRSPPIEMHELGRLRNRLATLIREHRKIEEEMIYAPLFALGNIEAMPQLKAALRQNKEEKSRYSEIVGRWTPQAIQADWPGYVQAVAERVEHLEWMVRFEEERIYKPVLDLIARHSRNETASR